MFELLEITAYPLCGIVSSDAFLPLDSILNFVVMRERYGPQELTTPGKQTIAKPALDGIFEVREKGDSWYYAASFAQWSEKTAQGKDEWTKRFDSEFGDFIDFQGKRGKVKINAGRYKAYRMPVFYKHALEIIWYVVGDIQGIHKLLRHVTHIGKKYSQGWGRIRKWEIKEIPNDWSERKNGKPTRSLPKKDGILWGIRPSYWDPENQIECELPDFT